MRTITQSYFLCLVLTFFVFSTNAQSVLVSSSTTIQEKEIQPDFDWSNLNAPVHEIIHGGPPKDGIVSIDDPLFLSPALASDEIKAEDLVVGINWNGVKKAYPVKILSYHEVVNDEINGQPIIVTYSPLCNSAAIYQATSKDQKLTFGISGRLYNNNTLLYDRESDGLWAQMTGEAISGKHQGTCLPTLGSIVTTWADWQKQHPNTQVLSTSTSVCRDYEKMAYADYHASKDLLFPISNRNKILPAKAPVIGVEINGQYKAYPLYAIPDYTAFVMEDEFNGQLLQIHRDKENNTAFITDLTGQLIPATTTYWFAWSAFYPETELYGAPKEDGEHQLPSLQKLRSRDLNSMMVLSDD